MNDEYIALLHAIQSGTAVEIARANPNAPDETLCAYKHLRVGIDSAMCNHAALVRILITKGLLTEAEYEREVIEELRREVHRITDRLGWNSYVESL